MAEKTDEALTQATAAIQGLNDDARPKAAVAALKLLLAACYALRDEMRRPPSAASVTPPAPAEPPA